jgi:hypothetical protein
MELKCSLKWWYQSLFGLYSETEKNSSEIPILYPKILHQYYTPNIKMDLQGKNGSLEWNDLAKYSGKWRTPAKCNKRLIH